MKAREPTTDGTVLISAEQAVGGEISPEVFRVIGAHGTLRVKPAARVGGRMRYFFHVLDESDRTAVRDCLCANFPQVGQWERTTEGWEISASRKFLLEGG